MSNTIIPKVSTRTVIRNGRVMQEPTEPDRKYMRGGKLLFDEKDTDTTWLLNELAKDRQQVADNFDFLKPLTYNNTQTDKLPHANKYAYGGIYAVFPYYSVDTGLGFRMPLGHGMAIAVNDKTGATRGSEYGRYDKDNNGIARRVTVPNLRAKDPSNPTEDELNEYAKQLDKMYGHSGGSTRVYYVKGADEDKMIELMQSAEKNKPDSFYQNRNYNIFDHNCGTYAADMIKESMPTWSFSGFGPYTYGAPSSIAPYWGTEGHYTEDNCKYKFWDDHKLW